MKKGEPFETWYTCAEVAERLGVTARTVARVVEADPELRAAAVFLFGCRRVPWSAWRSWLAKQPKFEFQPRELNHLRSCEVREMSEPTTAATVGGLRRVLKDKHERTNGLDAD